MDRDLNVSLEQLKRSKKRTILEEEKKEQAYVDVRVISSSLNTHKEELGLAWHQIYECKDTWLSSTRTQKEAKDRYEARIQALEAEV